MHKIKSDDSLIILLISVDNEIVKESFDSSNYKINKNKYLFKNFKMKKKIKYSDFLVLRGRTIYIFTGECLVVEEYYITQLK